jgi:glutathionylspermidine synthase
MRERAIAEYHELLMKDETLNEELFAKLKSGMISARLLYGQRALGVSLRPHFLMRRQYNSLVDRSQALAGALDKVAAAVLAEPVLMDRIGMRARERRLALCHPGFAQAAVSARLDAFIAGDRIKFVEYNAENPSSLTDQSGLNQVLFEVRALQLFAERYRMRQFTSAASLLNALLTTYHEWGGGGAPNIAILDWAGLPTEHEFILLRNYFVSNGLPTIICAPDELEYKDGRLRSGDFRIDIVYKRIIIHEFLDRYDDTHPLIRAYKNHDICLVNPFRCKLLHKKAVFEILTDEAFQCWFTPQELEVVRNCVPWTRRMSERKSFHQGREIDLIEYVRARRDDFILKPNDDYGGHGVIFGDRASESEWDRAIVDALKDDYIVQERVELQTEEFPIFNDREWGLQQMFVDTNPFIFRGVVDGAMVRLSDSPIVNVTSGGGETGFFVLDGD